MKYHQMITMHLYALKYADILSDLQLPVILTFLPNEQSTFHVSWQDLLHPAKKPSVLMNQELFECPTHKSHCSGLNHVYLLVLHLFHSEEKYLLQ